MLEMSEGHTRGSRSWKSGVDVVLEWNRVALVTNILDHNNPFLREDDSRRKLYWYNNPVDPSFIPSGNPAVTQGPPASSRVCHDMYMYILYVKLFLFLFVFTSIAL